MWEAIAQRAKDDLTNIAAEAGKLIRDKLVQAIREVSLSAHEFLL